MTKGWWVIALGLALAGGYWMGAMSRSGWEEGTTGAPVAQREEKGVFREGLLKASAKKDGTADPRLSREQPARTGGQAPGSEGRTLPNDEAAVYDVADPMQRIALENSLREEGFSEKDIREIVGSGEGDEDRGSEGPPVKALVYDMESLSDRAMLRSALESEGISREDIEKILAPPQEGFAGSHGPDENGVPEEAAVYDLNDESDRKALLAPLRGQNIPEEDIEKIMARSGMENIVPPPPAGETAESYSATNRQD